MGVAARLGGVNKRLFALLSDGTRARIRIEGSHWLWTGCVSKQGYGRMYHNRGTHGAHRVIYQILKGEIPEGLELDHLCRIRHCVNPTHLEPVTPRENLRRGVGIGVVNAAKTHCKQGHEFIGENLYVWRGWRKCRECMRQANNAHQANLRLREAA